MSNYVLLRHREIPDIKEPDNHKVEGRVIETLEDAIGYLNAFKEA